MNQSEYERRRQHLEIELEAALELVQAAFRTQLRALDLVWMNSPENGGSVAIVYDPPRAPRPVALFPAPADPALANVPSIIQKRRGISELYHQVLDALDSLPEVFDRTDLLALLEPRPKRSSLYKILEEMRHEGLIDLVQAGSGTIPSQYRRKDLDSAEPVEA
jgi:hypothetical protein